MVCEPYEDAKNPLSHLLELPFGFLLTLLLLLPLNRCALLKSVVQNTKTNHLPVLYGDYLMQLSGFTVKLSMFAELCVQLKSESTNKNK